MSESLSKTKAYPGLNNVGLQLKYTHELHDKVTAIGFKRKLNCKFART